MKNLSKNIKMGRWPKTTTINSKIKDLESKVRIQALQTRKNKMEIFKTLIIIRLTLISIQSHKNLLIHHKNRYKRMHRKMTKTFFRKEKITCLWNQISKGRFTKLQEYNIKGEIKQSLEKKFNKIKEMNESFEFE